MTYQSDPIEYVKYNLGNILIGNFLISQYFQIDKYNKLTKLKQILCSQISKKE